MNGLLVSFSIWATMIGISGGVITALIVGPSRVKATAALGVIIAWCLMILWGD